MAGPSVELLQKVPLFAGLEPQELERLSGSFKERTFSAGDTVASEGEGGAGFFVIESGEAVVKVHGDERGRLGPGDYFGDIAMIDHGRPHRVDRGRVRPQVLRPHLLGLPPARRERRAHRLAAAAGDGQAATRRRVRAP